MLKPAFVSLCILYLTEHYRDADVSLDAAARAVGCTPNHLGRLLRRYEGRSFRRLLVEKRISLAMQEIGGSATPLKELSYALGYRHPSAFCRDFRSLSGTSPSAWRAKALDQRVRSADSWAGAGGASHGKVVG